MKRIVRLELEGIKYLNCKDKIIVILPEGYSSNKKYTTVYFLHGLDEKAEQDIQRYNLEQIATENNEIIVCLNGHRNCWYLDSPIKGQMQYKSYFFEMIMPYINKHYSTDSDNIFITGISMGGHGAMTLFLDHPDIFKGAGSCSGVLDLKYSKSRDKTLAAVIGDYNDGKNENFKKYSANYNVKRLEGKEDKFIYVNCGTEDHVLDTSLNFLKECKKYHIEVQSKFSHGKHKHNYWAKSLYRHFQLFANVNHT